MQQIRKNLAIASYAPLWKEDCVGMMGLGKQLFELVHASDQGKVLEGVCPSMRVLVVCVEEVEFVDPLPEFDGFLGDLDLWDPLGQDLQECGLAAADVALDGIYYFFHGFKIN